MHQIVRIIQVAVLLALSVSVVAETSPALPGVPLQSPIAAQSLAGALQTWAQQSGVQVMYATELAAGLQSRGAPAGLSASAALEQLLAGTGLRFRVLNERTVSVIREADSGADLIGRESSSSESEANDRVMRLAQTGSGAAEPSSEGDELQTVSVFGTLDDRLAVGSKDGLSLRETPKSVTLVTRERIEAQNLQSLADALNQTTGITLAGYSAVESFWMSRGFRVTTIQLDGGAPAISTGFGSWLQPDMAVYDHVEVLRGVDGIYTGAGEPGGIINLVRKRAQRTPEMSFDASVGRWNSYRGELDVTGPLTADGRFRGRAVAAYQDNGYFFDRGESEKTIFLGTGEYDLTPDTLLVAGATYERRKEDGYYTSGMPRYLDGRPLDLPRSAAFNPDWNHWYFTTKEVFARVEHQLGGTSVVKLNATRLQQESQSRFMFAFGAVDPATMTGPMAVSRAYDFDSVQSLVDLSMSGTFPLFGREHRYTVGADYAGADGGGQRAYMLQGYWWSDARPLDVFNFDPAQFPQPAAILSGYYPESKQSQRGYYAALGFTLTEPLKLTLGGRYGEYRFDESYQDVDALGVYGDPSVTRYSDSALIPSVALTWDFASSWTAYASYAETFKVQASMLDAARKPLDPLTGSGFEAGVKAELFGFLNTALAAYRINRKGQGVRDPAYPPTTGSNGTSCCYLPMADITSKGVDLEASGTVAPGWQLFAGYTHNRNALKGTASLYEAYFLNLTPKHMFKMWTSYRLPGAAARWTLNGGVIAQSESLVNGLAVVNGDYVSYRFNQPGYATWNASVQYRVDDTWTVGLYGDNLFDKKYLVSIGDIFTDNVYGTPRNVVLTVRAQF